jgi:hypothetical protein
MAGGFGFKPDPKNKDLVKNNNSEILNDFHTSSADNFTNKLFGTLFPGQSIEINSSEKSPKVNWAQEFITKSTVQEQSIFINQHTQETQKAVAELQSEIKNLIAVTENLDQEIEQTISQNIAEISDYQLNFLERIKIIVVNFRKNISQSCVWLESFNHKKNKKNAFWGKVKNQKSGGEQYLFSNEHSASRSAN